MSSFKSFLLIFLSLLLFSLQTNSQWGWQQKPSGTAAKLNDISMKGNRGWIAGNNGTILFSSNLGNNWSGQNSNTTVNLNSICFIDTLTGFAAGDNGVVLNTTNGGLNWVTKAAPFIVNYYDIGSVTTYDSMAEIKNFYIVGDNGKIIRTTNNGNNWMTVISYTTQSLKSINLDYNYNGLITGTNGVILYSSNNGISWYITMTSTNVQINSAVVINHYVGSWSSPLGIACGEGGKILISIDMGYWTDITSPITSNLKSAATNSTNYVSMVSTNGAIYKSTNEGFNWTEQVTLNTPLNKILFTSSNVGWVVGDSGLIFSTQADNWFSDFKQFNINQINTWYSNNGSFNRTMETTNEPGCEYPIGSGKYARFASGIWIGAVVEGDTLVSRSAYNFDFLPGYTNSSGVSDGRNNYLYRNYVLNYGTNDSNRQRWPNALLGNSDQGAPVFFDTQSQTWKPVDFGDRTSFYTYTDGYEFKHDNYECNSEPLKADIKQINFAFAQQGGLGNSIISYYTIINRSTKIWNNVYISVWSDDDIGESSNDKAGCDTNLQLAYTYNYGDYDPIYVSGPPAAGLLMLKGPVTYTGSNNDTAFICEGKVKKIKTKYKQSGWGAFNAYEQPLLEPNSCGQCYNYMKGCDLYGNPYFNTFTNQVTTFPWSGEPQVNNGWVMEAEGDKRILLSAGPLSMNPGDTQVIAVAQVLAKGTSYYNSIVLLRQYSQQIIDNYKNCFFDIPIGIENNQMLIENYTLEQNYPNPFNPTTTIKYFLPAASKVRLTIYDLLGREVAILVNGYEAMGSHSVHFNADNLSSGVYFYVINAGEYTASKKMLLIK